MYVSSNNYQIPSKHVLPVEKQLSWKFFLSYKVSSVDWSHIKVSRSTNMFQSCFCFAASSLTCAFEKNKRDGSSCCSQLNYITALSLQFSFWEQNYYNLCIQRVRSACGRLVNWFREGKHISCSAKQILFCRYCYTRDPFLYFTDMHGWTLVLMLRDQ